MLGRHVKQALEALLDGEEQRREQDQQRYEPIEERRRRHAQQHSARDGTEHAWHDEPVHPGRRIAQLPPVAPDRTQ